MAVPYFRRLVDGSGRSAVPPLPQRIVHVKFVAGKVTQGH